MTFKSGVEYHMLGETDTKTGGVALERYPDGYKSALDSRELRHCAFTDQ
ncbi:hypothetical protein H8S90_15540 [Olivibacter sp. SDN3]|nr:hypothetical protein [Olivibacter sp. SDN3]QNL48209.1 hypothetical protein H8S90_15540 [Olivibacter sp. SDN3]